MSTEKSVQPAIRLHRVGVTYVDKNSVTEALREINLEVAAQEFVCVLGPSGSGKTTLLRVLAGLLKPSQGEVSFAGKKMTPRVGLVFQQTNLMPWRNVTDNISLPLELRGMPRERMLTKAEEMIKLIGLQDFAQSWPAALSGGMAQRVALVRALVHDPDLLLLDEPFGSLDALTREQMGAELLRIWQAQRKTVLMVTHSISEALLLADRVVVFTPRPGRISLDMQVDLPRPRREEVRYSTQFMRSSRQLRAAIG